MQEILRIALMVVLSVLQLAVPVLAIIGAIYLLRRNQEPVRRARLLKRIGMGVMGAVALFFGAFLIGETLSDPGGWRGVVGVATWLVPLVAVSMFAWFKPSWATPLLAVLTAGALLLEGWADFDVRVRELEDRIGPFTMVVLIAVAIAITALGHSRPRPAGIMLLIAGVGPALLAVIGTVRLGPGPVLFVILGIPMVLTATFYLGSARVGARATPPQPEKATVVENKAA